MSLKNVLDKSPIQIATAVQMCLNLLVLAGVLDIGVNVLAASNGALVSILGLFVANKTANKAVLNEIQEKFEQEGA